MYRQYIKNINFSSWKILIFTANDPCRIYMYMNFVRTNELFLWLAQTVQFSNLWYKH